METIVLLNFNNYYNRKIVKYDDINYYRDYVVYDPITNFSFKPGDDVYTTILLNIAADNVNYLIVIDEDTNTIASRWFVLETTRTRKGQYQLTLKRDSISDFYEDIKSAPMFIEKATLENDDPYIFNHEGLDFNQIKQSEYLLKDKTNTAWIVGYIAKYKDGAVGVGTEVNGNYKRTTADYTYTNISDFPYYKYRLNSGSEFIVSSADNLTMEYRMNIKNENAVIYPTLPENIELTFYVGGEYDLNNDSRVGTTTSTSSLLAVKNYNSSAIGYTKLSEYFYSVFKSKAIKINRDYIWSTLGHKTISDASDLLQYNNRILYDETANKYYMCKIEIESTSNTHVNIISTNSSYAIFNSAVNGLRSTNLPYGYITNDANDNSYYAYLDTTYYNIVLYEADYLDGELALTIPKNYPELVDAPYSMFCVPYPMDGEKYVTNGTNYTMTNDIALGIANTIANTLQPGDSGGSLYDLQLLPYCPIKDIVDGKIYDNTVPVYDNNHIQFAEFYFAISSNFDVDIPYTITIEDNKLSNELDLYRIVSPNLSSYDQFSPAINNGVDRIHVNCTYKPYNPYINVHIDYRNLYGKDFDDGRGLICTGDFSLPLITDAWTQYEIQNKNYQNIFARQQNSLKLQQKWEKAESITGAITGTVSGAVGGAMSGALVGGGVGAIAGGVVGGVASAAGGITDIVKTSQLQSETLSLNKDMFNYNNQNIQALPYGLAKNSGFFKNNKLFPFIEYYTCTERERKAFIDKLKYTGMTVGRTGTLSEFIKPELSYIQGKLIRVDEINCDYHVLNDISTELQKGIYI